jgi:hypothetical protein
MRVNRLITTLYVALGMGILLSGCGADLKDLFKAKEAESIDEFKATDDTNDNYVLIAKNLDDKYCKGTLVKIVALKYGFDDPTYLNVPQNQQDDEITCSDTLNKDKDHCRTLDIREANDDFNQKDIEGNTTCLLSTETNPNNDAFKELVYQETN